jgi:hypothetical protein
MGSIAIVLMTMGLANTAWSADDAAGICLAKEQLLERLICLSDAAKRDDDAGYCHRASQEAVRWQCVAILAEHKGDAALCRSIPRSDDQYRGLYDICLSDVAEVTAAPQLCSEIASQGLRNSCYLKLVRAGASSELCEQIADQGLRSACTGRPVYVD